MSGGEGTSDRRAYVSHQNAACPQWHCLGVRCFMRCADSPFIELKGSPFKWERQTQAASVAARAKQGCD